MGELYLHRHDGAKVQLTKAIKQRSANNLPNVFFEKVFEIDKLFPNPAVSETIKLTGEQLQAAWNGLAGRDEVPAFFALWRLVASPAQSVALLKENLKPAVKPDPQRFQQKLTDLGNPNFRVREQATRDLERKDTTAKPGIREAMERQSSPEALRRMKRLLTQIRDETRPPEVVQALRGVEVLARIGSTEAKAKLNELAGGAESAITAAAKLALERLK
jgi:hypothetical protein